MKQHGDEAAGKKIEPIRNETLTDIARSYNVSHSTISRL
jgi:hypothetical protein